MKTVNIYYHEECGSWWADSPDLPGWTSVGAGLQETRQMAIEGAREFVEGPVAINEMLPVTKSSSSVNAIHVNGVLSATGSPASAVHVEGSRVPDTRRESQVPRLLWNRADLATSS